METLPALWTLMDPTWDLSRDFATVHGPRLRRYLEDVPFLVGADLDGQGGAAPLIQGRSLIYRWCTCAPLWAGAFMGVSPVSPGLTRRICSGTVRHFLDRGAAADGILTMGWFGEFRPMAQFYSGVGSPYWASKGMLGLALPVDHPVWTADEEPLPVEREDTHRLIPTPGWMVSGTSADGVVRVFNLGTDGENEGDLVSEAPLYTSLGFSTATAPAQAGEWAMQPVANVIALRDAKGRVSCRSGQHVDRLEQVGDVLVGQSSWQVHWIEVESDSQVGYGARGESDLGPRIVCAQVCHSGTEVRCAWFDEDVAEASVVVAGWPTDPEQDPDSFLEPVTQWQGRRRPSAQSVTGLSEVTTVEQMETPMQGSGPYIALVGLGTCGPRPEIGVADGSVTVTFPGQPAVIVKP